jgi:hypothetical protein
MTKRSPFIGIDDYENKFSEEFRTIHIHHQMQPKYKERQVSHLLTLQMMNTLKKKKGPGCS